MRFNFSNTKKAYLAITEAINKQVPCNWLGYLSAPLYEDVGIKRTYKYFGVLGVIFYFICTNIK